MIVIFHFSVARMQQIDIVKSRQVSVAWHSLKHAKASVVYKKGVNLR